MTRSSDDAYRSNWNSAARADALTAILTPPDGSTNVESAFDALGLQDATWLRQFVDPSSVVLDIGCGIGRIEKHLAQWCAEIHSVDISDEMIARAQKWTKGRNNIHFSRTSGTDLSGFADAKFDFAFSYLVIQHMEYEDAFLTLQEVARVLKPSGKALLQFPSFHSPIYADSFVRQATMNERHATRVRMYTVDFARRLLELAGLRVVEVIERKEGTLNDHELAMLVQRDLSARPTE